MTCPPKPRPTRKAVLLGGFFVGAWMVRGDQLSYGEVVFKKTGEGI